MSTPYVLSDYIEMPESSQMIPAPCLVKII